MTDPLQSALQANGAATNNAVSRMGYASDVGIFCGVGGDTHTSTTGAWKRNRNYCPNGISACPGIVANFSQRTGHTATVLTQGLPDMQADVLLPAMRLGQFPTYQVPVVFTSVTRYPYVNAFKNGMVGGVYCTQAVLQSSSGGLNTFTCNLVISPANLSLSVYQAEQARIAAAKVADPSVSQGSLFNYLAKPAVTSFSVLLQIDTPPFTPASRNFVINVKRPTPDNYYPPTDTAGDTAEGGAAEGGAAEGGAAEGDTAEGGAAEGDTAEGGTAEGGTAGT